MVTHLFMELDQEKHYQLLPHPQCFLDRYPKRKVIFVGPTSLLRNFEKELIRYGVTKHDIATKYEMLSFDGMMNRCKKQNQ